MIRNDGWSAQRRSPRGTNPSGKQLAVQSSWPNSFLASKDQAHGRSCSPAANNLHDSEGGPDPGRAASFPVEGHGPDAAVFQSPKDPVGPKPPAGGMVGVVLQHIGHGFEHTQDCRLFV